MRWAHLFWRPELHLRDAAPIGIGLRTQIHEVNVHTMHLRSNHFIGLYPPSTASSALKRTYLCILIHHPMDESDTLCPKHKGV